MGFHDLQMMRLCCGGWNVSLYRSCLADNDKKSYDEDLGLRDGMFVRFAMSLVEAARWREKMMEGMLRLLPDRDGRWSEDLQLESELRKGWLALTIRSPVDWCCMHPASVTETIKLDGKEPVFDQPPPAIFKSQRSALLSIIGTNVLGT